MAFAKGGAGQGAAGSVDDLGAPVRTTEKSSFGADIDLIADSPAGCPGACRGVMCTDAGAGTRKLQLLCADGSTVTIDCTNIVGVFSPGAFRKILSAGTTIARVLVYY